MNTIIANLERQASNDFVTVVHYRIEKSDDENTASTYGTVSYTESDDFTPFDELTEVMVTGWVHESLDMEAIEASLDAQLAEMAQPQSISGMPW